MVPGAFGEAPVLLNNQVGQLGPAVADGLTAPLLGVVAQPLLGASIHMDDLTARTAEHQTITGLQQKERVHPINLSALKKPMLVG